MTVSRAFAECTDVLERALHSERGIKIEFLDTAAAVRFRARCNKYRVQLRKESKVVYSSDHPMYGRSPYDSLILQLEGLCVYVRKDIELTDMKITEIREDDMNI